MATQARVAGTVKIDGVAAARDVIVIKDDPAGRQVVAEGQSAGDGTFDITYNDWAGAVIALALDEYGDEFAPETALNAGQVVHPETPNGYVYKVTVAGTTGTEEPTWSTSGSVTSGGVTFNALPYYRPVASGPLEGDVVAVEFVEFEDYFAESLPDYYWDLNESSGPLIRKPDETETAFPTGTSISRGEEGLAAYGVEGNASYLFSAGASDYIDLGLQSDFMDQAYTICVAIKMADHTENKLHFLLGSTGTATRKGFYIGYDNRQSVANTTRAIKAFISPVGSGWRMAAADDAIADNDSHIIALVCEPGVSMNLYVDGSEVASLAECPIVAGGNSIVLGNAMTASGFSADFASSATIDNVGFWLEAKTPEWVEALAARFFEEPPA